MARFDRQEASDARLEGTLEAAARDLRAALEREAVEVLNRAREEAAGLLDSAREEARDLERTARRKADELEAAARSRAEEAEGNARARAEEAQAAARSRAEEIEREASEKALVMESDRLACLKDGVDAVEDRMRAMLDDLREQLNGVAHIKLGAASGPAPTVLDDEDDDTRLDAPASLDPVLPAVRPDAVPPDPVPSEAPAAVEPPTSPTPAPAPPSATAEAEEATERNPQLDAMMRAQLMSMRDTGRTRSEAERFLARFKSGAGYIGLLDEFYPPHEQPEAPAAGKGRRRRFGRRRS